MQRLDQRLDQYLYNIPLFTYMIDDGGAEDFGAFNKRWHLTLLNSFR